MIIYKHIMSQKKKIKNLCREYKQLSENLENLYRLSEIALDIFYELASFYNLSIKKVELKKTITEEFGKLLLEMFSIPEYGSTEIITQSKGTVIFVDITNSTKYFKDKYDLTFKENYTGFVIFNSYILLIKTITRLAGGEFLEHTGDGALIFYRDKNIIDEFYRSLKDPSLLNKNPLWLYFIVSEYLKGHAKQKKLITFDKDTIYISTDCILYEEPALVHMGAAYGEVVEINFGNIKKLISNVVWEAADNCKKSERRIMYYNDNHNSTPIYIKCPIKLPHKVKNYGSNE